MTEKYLELNLNDEKAGKVAEILANKTAKKILGLIADKEMSENDISKELGLAINTVDYNIKKLLESGLIEKSKNFFWSVKGRRIETYRLANKKIIISTKPVFKLLPFVLVAGAVGFATSVFKNIFSFSSRLYGSSFTNVASNVAEKTSDIATSGASMPTSLGAEQTSNIAANLASSNTSFWSLFSNSWIWVLCGVLAGLIIFFVYKKLIAVRGSNNL